MFDEDAPQSDKPVAPVQPPANPAAPSSDVPELFDGSDQDAAHLEDLSPETSLDGPSALEAGKLQPTIDSSHAAPPSELSHPTPPPPEDPAASMMQAPHTGKNIIIAVIVVVAVLAIAGGVAWAFMGAGSSTSPTPITTAPVDESATEKGGDIVDIDVTAPPSAAPAATSTEFVPTLPEFKPDEESTKPVEPEKPAVDQNKDTDKDGLPDVREEELGTNPNNPDSDSDGLGDGAEVSIWGTDVLKSDTDGDTFPDGQEVMNGFNPKGPGRLQ